jgi:hypothetical protein
MTGLFVLLALIVILGIAATVLLKREGDKAWRLRQQREQRHDAISAAMMRLNITIVDQMTPAFIEVGRAAARAGAEMQRLAKALESKS